VAVVLVTGGAGFIGAHACKALQAAGHVPVCFDNFSTGWREAARFGPLVEGDLLDARAVRTALDDIRPDAVMHFAALSLVGDSVRDPARYWRSNLTGALNLFDAMRDAGVMRLIFSSTAATYGEPEATLIREDTPQRPTNPYGASKLAIERVIADYGAAYGLNAMVFRYFNVAGADPDGEIGESHRPESHLIPIVLEAAAGLRPEIVVNGCDYPTADGACVRDYLHVCDLVEAHRLGLDKLLSDHPGLHLNLGIGHGYSVLEVIEAARRVTGRDIAVRIGPRRAGDPARLVCDGQTARDHLDWSPKCSDLDTMIRDAWRWISAPRYPAGTSAG
jgi:UDP-glucose-4-epimerase GalE